MKSPKNAPRDSTLEIKPRPIEELDRKIARCECPLDAGPPMWASSYLPEEVPSWNHKANECSSTSELALYRAGNRLRWLCSACVLSGDEKVELG